MSNLSPPSHPSSTPSALAKVPPLHDSPKSASQSVAVPEKTANKPLWRKYGWAIVGAAILGGGLYWQFGGTANQTYAELLTHQVKKEDLDMTVVERGTLESSDNKEIICRVKAGSKGNYAATIKWVIDDGTMVRKGQPIMVLDSSMLEDQLRTQRIAMEQAHAKMIAGEQNYRIQLSENESLIEAARIQIQLAELDLEKFAGIPKGTLVNRKREESRILLLEMEASLESFLDRHRTDFPDAQGDFHKQLNELVGQIELAEADVEMWKDRVAYSQRMQLKGYLSPAQVQADDSRLASAREALKKVKTDKQLLQDFNAQRTIKELSGKVQEAWRAYDRAVSQAQAKEVQLDADRKTSRSVFLQEEEKLKDIEDQIKQCKIHAPQDGMVVYYIPESSRWSNSERGLIQQGASVQEGQKMMRLPDLRYMQVTTRVHEAMVSYIRGDDRRSTGINESVRAALMLNWSPLNGLLSQFDECVEMQRDEYIHKEYYLASKGQPATIRVDAMPDRPMKGHVKTVATVASSSDFMSSDVKVYTTVVSIDDPIYNLRPGMSAEVTIQVSDTKKNVLVVPVQAVIGGAESGEERTIYVLTDKGPQERKIKIGLSNEKMVEVINGIEEGENVITNPKAILGDKIKTREPGSDRGGKGEGKGRGKGPKGGAKESNGEGGAPDQKS